jgi:hypothetical protein
MVVYRKFNTLCLKLFPQHMLEKEVFLKGNVCFMLYTYSIIIRLEVRFSIQSSFVIFKCEI